MSDKSPEEGEKRPESGLKEAAKTETSIATPKEQNTWHQSQETHFLPEDESATHLALRPDQLKDLKAQGLAEKFEIVGFEAVGAEAAKGIKLFGPLENILKEGLISKSFLGLKHELGHALYYALKIDNWSDFKRISQTEKQKLDEETRGHLEHLLESDNELFAETYALIRGRHTSRTEWLNFGFPDTVALVKKMLNQQAEQKDQ